MRTTICSYSGIGCQLVKEFVTYNINQDIVTGAIVSSPKLELRDFQRRMKKDNELALALALSMAENKQQRDRESDGASGFGGKGGGPTSAPLSPFLSTGASAAGGLFYVNQLESRKKKLRFGAFSSTNARNIQ